MGAIGNTVKEWFGGAAKEAAPLVSDVGQAAKSASDVADTFRGTAETGRDLTQPKRREELATAISDVFTHQDKRSQRYGPAKPSSFFEALGLLFPPPAPGAPKIEEMEPPGYPQEAPPFEETGPQAPTLDRRRIYRAWRRHRGL